MHNRAMPFFFIYIYKQPCKNKGTVVGTVGVCFSQTKDYKETFLRAILASDFEKTLQRFKVGIFTLLTVLLVLF